jgi:hypothetical protein
MQISRKDGSNLSPTEASMIAMHYGGYIDDLEKMRAYGDLRKMTNYFGKQHEKHRHHFGYHTSVLITWRDYIADCRRLGLNLSEESVLFPRNLHRAHQNTIKQIKVKEDEMLNKKIRARLKSLEKYSFEHEQTGLMLRPAADSKELINEGKGLNHCVGTYAQRYASGETNIFFVRKISEPDKPYFTVEVKYNEVRQVRGKNNCTPGEDVNEFMDAFINQRLRPENKKGKVKSAVPA